MEPKQVRQALRPFKGENEEKCERETTHRPFKGENKEKGERDSHQTFQRRK